MSRTICSECNAQYNSERELRDHMGIAHRMFGREQSGSEPGEPQGGAPGMQRNEEQDPLI